MATDDAFDALGAAAELEDALSGKGASVPALEADLVALRAKLADTERTLRAAEARANHAEEEVSLARERLAREAQQEVARGSRRVLLDMLEVLDDLERALDAAWKSHEASPLLKGIDLLHRRFLAALEKHGVDAFEAEGQPFNPALHEAISVVAATNAAQDGRVVGVLRTGYRMGDEVIRPAGVVVAKRR